MELTAAQLIEVLNSLHPDTKIWCYVCDEDENAVSVRVTHLMIDHDGDAWIDGYLPEHLRKKRGV